MTPRLASSNGAPVTFVRSQNHTFGVDLLAYFLLVGLRDAGIGLSAAGIGGPPQSTCAVADHSVNITRSG
ncbi:hypothetical protein ACFL5O_10980 [Myxococcota bacterium]